MSAARLTSLTATALVLAAGVGSTLALTGCVGSTPATQWYTLVPPEPALASPAAREANAQATHGHGPARAVSADSRRLRLIDVLEVKVPERLDHPQLTLTLANGSMRRLEQSQWASPLSQELRDALSVDLAQRLGATDIHRAPRAGDVWRVTTSLSRMDAVAFGVSTLQAAWSVRLQHDPARSELARKDPARSDPARSELALPQSCETTIQFSGATQPEQFVLAWRRAIGVLADSIAATISALETQATDGTTAPERKVDCPPAGVLGDVSGLG